MRQLRDGPAEYPFPATMQVDLTRFSWRGQSAIISLQDPSCLAAPRTLQSLANLEFPPTVEDTPPPPQLDSEYSNTSSEVADSRSSRGLSGGTARTLAGSGPPRLPLRFIESVSEYFVAGQELKSQIFPPTPKAKWHALDNTGEHVRCREAVDRREACNLRAACLLIPCGY
jgi:hypothetical protein